MATVSSKHQILTAQTSALSSSMTLSRHMHSLMGILLLLTHVARGRAEWPRVMSSGNSTGKTLVHIVGIQPYSGSVGALGYKVEPAIALALEHIDAHPTLLQAHKFVLHFYDSACSMTTATNVLFNAHNALPRKFGVYGAACTDACKASSTISRNFATVNMAPLCTGTPMSDTTTYPEFARFAPDLGKNSMAALRLASIFGWEQIALVAESVGLFESMRQEFVGTVRNSSTGISLNSGASFNIVSDAIGPDASLSDEEYNLQRVAPVVSQLVAAEARVVVFLGYERTLARVLCESYLRGFVGPRMVFISATFWITSEWSSEFASNTRCTPSQLQNAGESLLGIDRLRLAADSQGNHGGSGLLPSEIMQAYHDRCNPSCSDMHAAYSYDAMWGWAFTMDRWLAAGNSVTSVDYLNSSARKSFFAMEVSHQDFVGLTGRVRHFPNGDRDGQLQLFQIQSGVIVTLGSIIDQGETIQWSPGARIIWGGDANLTFNPGANLSLGPVPSCGEKAVNDSACVPASQPKRCQPDEVLIFELDAVLTSERCEKCPPGTSVHVHNEITQCVQCQPGQYSPRAGMFSCELCEAGSMQPLSGKSSCTACPSGSHTPERGTPNCLCREGFYEAANASGCEPCPIRFLSSTSSHDCPFWSPVRTWLILAFFLVLCIIQWPLLWLLRRILQSQRDAQVAKRVKLVERACEMEKALDACTFWFIPASFVIAVVEIIGGKHGDGSSTAAPGVAHMQSTSSAPNVDRNSSATATQGRLLRRSLRSTMNSSVLSFAAANGQAQSCQPGAEILETLRHIRDTEGLIAARQEFCSYSFTTFLKANVLEKVQVSAKVAFQCGYQRDYLAVSHRWITPNLPDAAARAEGVQLDAIAAHLKVHKTKHVYYDFWCMPQQPRTPEEDVSFKWMLENLSLLFIGCSVLILLDRSYCSRFWVRVTPRD